MLVFDLPYYVSNNGDGSASVDFCANPAEAETKDEAQSEGWGESSASKIKLMVDGEKLYFQDFQEVDGAYKNVWVEVKG